MSFVNLLPKADIAYDAFRAKLSLLYVLYARGYNLGKDKYYLDSNISIHTKYLHFKEENPPTGLGAGSVSDKVYYIPKTEYKNDSGFMSPLNVIFTEAARVKIEIENIMIELNIPRKSKTIQKPKHYLFVTEVPTSESVGRSIIGINTLEILSYQNLYLNPLHHCRAPLDNQKLSLDEKEKMLSNPVLSGKILPGLNIRDPMVLFLNLGPGDVYRSIDTKIYTGQNISSVNYRIAPRSVKCVSEGCKEFASSFRTPYCRECLQR